MKKVYNFSAGPAMLPMPVMAQAKKEFLDWNDLGISAMEVSHRSTEFIALMDRARANVRCLLDVPEHYEILFVHGGARGQFSAIAQNFLGDEGEALYLTSGLWSKLAAEEASQFAKIHQKDILKSDSDLKSISLPRLDSSLGDFRYVHYCPNETIDGLEIAEPLDSPWPVFADMTSCIFSRKIDVKKFGLIYAGSQKNMGATGFALVIVDRNLFKLPKMPIPSILNYQLQAEYDSLYNTPTTYSIYLASLIYQWFIDLGGLQKIEAMNEHKATLLYDCIDSTHGYQNHIDPEFRSNMNVVFTLNKPEKQELFLSEADKVGLFALKGHRLVGGFRASIYNAMPEEGVQALVTFMKKFSQDHLV